ncbi:CLUMA_CG013443, isoform A [Clunio marinus]|uniref:CLUMA_CG013443, isoform A n=1 Tax=Clunio marinus TaxID=568069 RepID=A0A1J1IIU7_9DIPT|nr:CLUMA_CG013443, isoform A [Clunio marinus]
MSRAKLRGSVDTCDAPFASLNRGILLCSDCASIHRSLGTHVSIVKALRQGCWNPSVLNYINQINGHGANSVWEHVLLDPSSKQQKRKPSSKDSIPVKSQFIRAKHVNLEFVLKPTLQADNSTSLEKELSTQLHASVRSSNLETSLRLLVQGADPNFIHEEKGSTMPLHVAAKFGQAAQIELLLVYGADINATDGSGNTAIDHAKQNQFTQIAERLTEASFEVTDRIIYFLCGRKPDHSSGQHLIIPEQSRVEINEHLKIARGKLQLIPNKMFEELVMDLYEEVDRREMETIWSTCSPNPEVGGVPFLPTNPHLSATRNQGRQKLARFSHVEFCGLLSDILVDARRRQNIANLRPLDQVSTPLPPNITLNSSSGNLNSIVSAKPPTPTNVHQQSPVHNASTFNPLEVETLKNQLKNSELTISELKTIVEKLAMENSMLKTRIDSQIIPQDVQLKIHDASDTTATEVEPVLDVRSSTANGSGMNSKRPVSMYEARQTPREENRPTITQSLYSVGSSSSNSSNSNQPMPLVEEVTKRTEVVTRRIQELWLAMQDLTKKDAFVPCSERIRVGVEELIAIFPPTMNDEVLKSALRQLNLNTASVQTECTNLQRALIKDNPTIVEIYLQQVRNCAYNLAKATKTLVTQFQQ